MGCGQTHDAKEPTLMKIKNDAVFSRSLTKRKQFYSTKIYSEFGDGYSKPKIDKQNYVHEGNQPMICVNNWVVYPGDLKGACLIPSRDVNGNVHIDLEQFDADDTLDMSEEEW